MLARYLIQKIGLDDLGRINRVQWQLADLDANGWIDQPAVVDLEKVVEVLEAGKVVGTVLYEEGLEYPGPLVRLVDDGGHLTIEAEPDGSGTTLRKLARLP